MLIDSFYNCMRQHIPYIHWPHVDALITDGSYFSIFHWYFSRQSTLFSQTVRYYRARQLPTANTPAIKTV